MSTPPPSQPPPHGLSDFVAPAPVYGVEQADGRLVQPRTVAEGAAAVRARVAAAAGVVPASGGRRAGAGLIDLALGVGIAFGVAAARPVPVAALVGVAIAATFVRIVVATMTRGASSGRLVLGTRAVQRDGAAGLGLEQVAVREGFVLLYVLFTPWWLLVLAERIVASWFLQADIGSVSAAPVPQDESTGMTVATVAEVRRVREGAAQAARPTSAAAASASALHARTAAPGPPSPGPVSPGLTSASPDPTSAGPNQPTVAPAANLPRIAAAPFIPAAVDPDLTAARAALTESTRDGGMAVHTMQAPEIARRVIAATIDCALIVSLAGLLVSMVSTGSAALVPGLDGLGDPRAANAIPVTLIAWFLLRPAAITAFTQTLGQWLMHYRVYASRGKRVGLGTALLREASGWGALVALAWASGTGLGYGTTSHVANADLLEENPAQPRLSHDRIADTWPVRI